MRGMAALWIVCGWMALAAAASGASSAEERTAAELKAQKEAEFQKRVDEYNEAERNREANRAEFVRDLPRFRVARVTFLDPRLQGKVPAGAARLHGYAVFSTAAVEDEAISAGLMSSLSRVVEARTGGFAACFSPRHVLHLTDGTRAYDVVTCFECSRYIVTRADGGTWFGDSIETRREEPEWTRLFRQAGLEWPFK
jgi:hypothetical protein